MYQQTAIADFVYPIDACIINNEAKTQKSLFASTGFLYRLGCDFYFITTLSTVLGREVPTGEFKLKSKLLPTTLKTNLSIYEDDLVHIKRRAHPILINIYDDDLNPLFYIHPKLKKEVDLAVFPIRANGIDLVALNDFDTKQETNCQTVCLAGYPLYPQQNEDKTKPVFQEKKITQIGKNIFTIEDTDRIGMYGAAVFEAFNDPSERSFSFLGVYSGLSPIPSLNAKKKSFVWKKSFINEIIDARYTEASFD